MKKLIAVVVIVIVVLVLAKMLDITFSLSMSRDKQNREGKKLRGRAAVEFIINGAFPETATDMNFDQWSDYHRDARHRNILEQNYWVVAKITQEDFYGLVEQLKLSKRPDLLEFWSEAFGVKQKRTTWFWDIKNVVNEDTYFGENAKQETYTAAKYENGKVYIRRIVTSIKVTDEEGNVRYEQVKDGQSKFFN